MKSISKYRANVDPDVVWLKLNSGQTTLGIYYDCQWMRDEPEYDSVPDAFMDYFHDGGNHIELDQIQGWWKASDPEIRAAELAQDTE